MPNRILFWFFFALFERYFRRSSVVTSYFVYFFFFLGFRIYYYGHMAYRDRSIEFGIRKLISNAYPSISFLILLFFVWKFMPDFDVSCSFSLIWFSFASIYILYSLYVWWFRSRRTDNISGSFFHPWSVTKVKEQWTQYSEYIQKFK